jgi:hypothetical protein
MEALEHFRSYIRAHRKSRFVWHSSGQVRGEQKILQIDGYVSESSEGNMEYQFPERIPQAVCKPFGEAAIIGALESIGALDKDGSHRKKKRVLPDYPKKQRCYVVKHDRLFPEDDDADFGSSPEENNRDSGD